MKVKLRDGLTIDTSKIKSLQNKPKRLYVSFGKEIKVDYSIEWTNGTFTEIDKQEYKHLQKLINKNIKKY